MHRAVKIIGAAVGRGAQDPRTEYGPDKLREAGLVDLLRAKGVDAAWELTVYPHYGINKTEPAALIADFSARLMATVANVLRRGEFPVVIGGDHSCAIGTWSGVYTAIQDKGNLGLIWIDAHLDSHTPYTTTSGAIHGMPLAALLGHGEDALVNVGGSAPKVLGENVCLIGARSFEEGEAELLRQLNVRVFSMAEVFRDGMLSIFERALTLVSANTYGFGISLDLDAIDPQEAPGVGSPSAEGITSSELLAALRCVRAYSNFLAIELTEFNPFRDHDDKTRTLVTELLAQALGD